MNAHPQRYIVAEISKSWPDESTRPAIMAALFEGIIEHNLARGYRLHTWNFAARAVNGGLIETIIAVFEWGTI